jgi:hypothetical protein
MLLKKEESSGNIRCTYYTVYILARAFMFILALCDNATTMQT